MRRYLAVSLTVRRLCMWENHQFAGKWARHFARLSIINSIIDVNPFFGHWRLTTAITDGRRHSRLDNAGPEGDYSIFDERPFLQAISETPVSDRVDRAQFQSL